MTLLGDPCTDQTRNKLKCAASRFYNIVATLPGVPPAIPGEFTLPSMENDIKC